MAAAAMPAITLTVAFAVIYVKLAAIFLNQFGAATGTVGIVAVRLYQFLGFVAALRTLKLDYGHRSFPFPGLLNVLDNNYTTLCSF